MRTPWLDPDVFAVVFLGAACPLVALLALLTRTASRPGPWWAAAALGSAALAGAAALAGQPRGLWLPPAALAGACGAFLVLRSDRVAWAAGALLAVARRREIQAAALIVAGPALGAAWLGWTAPDIPRLPDPPDLLLTDEWRPLAAEPSAHATTDAGRAVPLYQRAGPAPTAEALWASDLGMISVQGLADGVIRTGPPSDDYDCHGWVFTGGRAWVVGAEVPAILEDNGYRPVADPRAGDLVLYRHGLGPITHTAVVRASWPGGLVLVEGKWGRGGRFLTAAASTPYGAPAYYRSPRKGHLLRGFEAQGAVRSADGAGDVPAATGERSAGPSAPPRPRPFPEGARLADPFFSRYTTLSDNPLRTVVRTIRLLPSRAARGPGGSWRAAERCGDVGAFDLGPVPCLTG